MDQNNNIIITLIKSSLINYISITLLILLFCCYYWGNNNINKVTSIIATVAVVINLIKIIVKFEILNSDIQIIYFIIGITLVSLLAYFILLKKMTIFELNQKYITYIYLNIVNNIPVINWFLFIKNSIYLNLLNFIIINNLKTQKLKMLALTLVVVFSHFYLGLYVIVFFLTWVVLTTNAIKFKYQTNEIFRLNFNRNVNSVLELQTKVSDNTPIKGVVTRLAGGGSKIAQTVADNPKTTMAFVSLLLGGSVALDMYDTNAFNSFKERQYRTDLDDHNLMCDRVDKYNDKLRESYRFDIADANKRKIALPPEPKYKEYPPLPVAPDYQRTRLFSIAEKYLKK